MRIAVPAETDPAEARVAATPETVKKLIALGASVAMKSGAGSRSSFPDRDYTAAGATIAPDAGAALVDADIILRVRRPSGGELAGAKKGALLLAILDPYGHIDALQDIAATGVDAFAMELMPRITRAQVMDVLSSQANLAGYRAVVDAAAEYGRAVPMMMTAAGTVPAAKAFIMGVGVAGLQAIATARRLGAIVTATDVRPATKEQVEISWREIHCRRGRRIQAGRDGRRLRQGNVGGLSGKAARADRFAYRQAGHRHHHGVIPGRPAPKLVTEAMIASMRPGSIIVDLAAERGGNTGLTRPGEKFTTDNGVTILGYLNVAGRLGATASSLYARNLLALVDMFVDKSSKALAVNWDDEVVKATLLTKDGALVHPNFQKPA